MTELITALDNYTPLNVGENGHAEYSYSNSIRERVVQLSFQLTRITDGSSMDPIEKVLKGLLTELRGDLDNKKWMSGTSIDALVVLYKMISHTRDVTNGKGEYALSYMMIYVWDQYWPELAKYALRAFVRSENDEAHPYGSWKDIKHFCTYIKGRNHTIENSELMRSAVLLLNEQLKVDRERLTSGEPVTLAGKWAPREKSAKNGWLHEILAQNYYVAYLQSAKTPESLAKAKQKAKMDYRKMLSMLNAHLGTVQVKQCAKKWADISPNAQTSITLHKQKRAFLNQTKKGLVKHDDPDRIECAEHFNAYIEDAVNGKVIAKGARVSMVDFTKDALNNSNKSPLSDLLDAQWEDSSKSTGLLGNMIAMVDTSSSMSGDPLLAAIALGIRVAEKSILGKRVMTFNSVPAWVNLDRCHGFTQTVNLIANSPWGGSTNFYTALNMILSVIVEKKLSSDVVKDLILVVFSDMQINEADRNGVTMHAEIANKYANAGIEVCGTPYTAPHIVFWNLRSTTGFPVLSTQRGASMMSGFSPALLNTFCEKGWEELSRSTPWNTLKEQIDVPRYDHVQHKCMEMVEAYQRKMR